MNHRDPADQQVIVYGEMAWVLRDWAKLYWEMTGSNLNTRGTAFLHECVSPGGRHRLVAVDLLPDGSGLLMVGRVIQIGNLWEEPRELQRESSLRIDASNVFAGQPDPSDRSHFTIVTAVPAARRLIDGYLRDDDTLVLQLRPLIDSQRPSP